MSSRGLWWSLWFFVLLLSAYCVPFIMMQHVQKASGAFLFWCVFALIAIFSIAKVTAGWRDV
ncbi:MAG: hypothetical protein AB1576_06945 [Bacillota bacterium]